MRIKRRCAVVVSFGDIDRIYQLAIAMLIIALIAGALGFTGVARGAANIAKVIFVAFIVIAGLIFSLGLLGTIALF